MKSKVVVFGILVGCLFLLKTTKAQHQDASLVRIAEIEIDPAQLEAYKTALCHEIDTSIRLEPGVLALYAVAVKNQPNQIRLFEIYSGEKAYRAHLQSAHFLKYKVATKGMVKSLMLVEAESVDLGVRGQTY